MSNTHNPAYVKKALLDYGLSYEEFCNNYTDQELSVFRDMKLSEMESGIESVEYFLDSAISCHVSKYKRFHRNPHFGVSFESFFFETIDRLIANDKNHKDGLDLTDREKAQAFKLASKFLNAAYSTCNCYTRDQRIADKIDSYVPTFPQIFKDGVQSSVIKNALEAFSEKIRKNYFRSIVYDYAARLKISDSGMPLWNGLGMDDDEIRTYVSDHVAFNPGSNFNRYMINDRERVKKWEADYTIIDSSILPQDVPHLLRLKKCETEDDFYFRTVMAILFKDMGRNNDYRTQPILETLLDNHHNHADHGLSLISTGSIVSKNVAYIANSIETGHWNLPKFSIGKDGRRQTDLKHLIEFMRISRHPYSAKVLTDYVKTGLTVENMDGDSARLYGHAAFRTTHPEMSAEAEDFLYKAFEERKDIAPEIALGLSKVLSDKKGYNFAETISEIYQNIPDILDEKFGDRPDGTRLTYYELYPNPMKDTFEDVLLHIATNNPKYLPHDIILHMADRLRDDATLSESGIKFACEISKMSDNAIPKRVYDHVILALNHIEKRPAALRLYEGKTFEYYVTNAITTSIINGKTDNKYIAQPY